MKGDSQSYSFSSPRRRESRAEFFVEEEVLETRILHNNITFPYVFANQPINQIELGINLYKIC